ncbi:MAG: 16S rRNA (cytidine(1402)-2'-O)-methyltransferase [Acidimicrobiia bacterium]
MTAGALVLVATPIGNLGDLTARAVDTLREADVIAAEDTRRTRTLLAHARIPAAGRLRALHAHNERATAPDLVELVRDGKRVAYVTDAGMPGVSDPGAVLVRAVLDAGLAVEVVPGASALLTALVLSGLPTDRFAFEGFLPRKGPERRARLGAIGGDDRTTVLFESPRRVAATLRDLADACGDDRPVAVARELTKLHEEVWRGTVGEARDWSERKGEHVIVVGPAPPATTPAPTGDEIDAALLAELGAGASARDAAAAVAASLGIARRAAYDRAVALRRRAP